MFDEEYSFCVRPLPQNEPTCSRFQPFPQSVAGQSPTIQGGTFISGISQAVNIPRNTISGSAVPSAIQADVARTEVDIDDNVDTNGEELQAKERISSDVNEQSS